LVIAARLGVNIDHVATVRQARRTDEPDPVWAAAEAQLGGADGITFHLREDRRHIIDRDVPLLRETVGVKLNMEMAIAPEIVEIACRTQPDQCCLVPEKREEVTTEGGLDVVGQKDRVARAVTSLKDAGIYLSAFIEPVEAHLRTAKQIGFDAVELWTGGYAHARGPSEVDAALAKLRRAIDLGIELGLEVHGGHGLTYRNIGPVAALPGFSEFNIGHSIIARSIFVGLREAVREMKALIVRHAPGDGGG
jgi:pyridoxine 5-phosphate synthase